MLHFPRLRRIGVATLAAAALACGAASGAAAADEATISYVESGDDGLQILVSVPPDATIDLANVAVTIDGEGAVSSASLVESTTTIKRTSVLAIDTSQSMAGKRFQAAKKAASAFLDSVPDDVYVGIVTFDSDVETPLTPTQDRDAARTVLEGLSLAKQTSLYDGVLAAVDVAGDECQRGVLSFLTARTPPTPSWPTSPPRSARVPCEWTSSPSRRGARPSTRWSRWPRPVVVP
jgi:tight adherence protein B